MLHTLARALERGDNADGLALEEIVRLLLGNMSDDVLHEVKGAVEDVRTRERPARGW